MHLMRKQSEETPVTLNALISAFLLQEENESIMLSTMLSKASVIYDYLKAKVWLKTYMTVRPMSILSLKHLRGLGFEVKKVKKDFRI